MEHHKKSLQDALGKLSVHQPDGQVWGNIENKLNDIPLQKALTELPQHEPDDLLWTLIEAKTGQKRRPERTWWYAAAVAVLGSAIGFYLAGRNLTESVSYSQEAVDARLQAGEEPETNDRYQILKAYCEAETLVCSSKDFKRLKNEYETLDTAAEQLKQAMGAYNTEPELMRQFSNLEQEKAEVLNEMAKMI